MAEGRRDRMVDYGAGERRRNPLIKSPLGGRLLSATQLPLFAVRPPNGYGILTTTGRVSGKPRRRCVRAPRSGDRAYLVAIRGSAVTAWAKNIRANPDVRLRLPGGHFRGRARGLEPDEREEALRVYLEPRSFFERLEYRNWRSGRPTRERIDDLHRSWFERGTAFVVELRPD
ncbi:MAG: nitroreductase family deazaflavin-dependent oxidoreductase [Solirubrobacterales bacterium]